MDSRKVLVVLAALATAACGKSSHDAGDAVTSDWVARESCWKDVLAAAAACTDPAAVGTFDAPQTTCTYADGTVVHVDPAALVTSSGPWDVAVLTSTGTPCAWLLSSGEGRSLTTRLGTFSVDQRALPWVFTCPDGSRFHLEDRTRPGEAGCCAPPLTAQVSYAFSGLVTFGFWSVAPKMWRCQGAPFDPLHPASAP